MRYALAAQMEGEQRQWQRQIWAGAAMWGNELPKDIGQRILPDYRDRSHKADSPSVAPYPVHPEVARALNDALALGLLENAVWASWPAARDGRPLARIWEGLALTGGLGRK